MGERKLLLLKGGENREMTGEEAYIQFQRFLYRLALRHSTNYGIEDMLSVANVGFAQAYLTYDASKGILFMSYLGKVVVNQLNRYHRGNKKRLFDVSMQEISNTDSDGDQQPLKIYLSLLMMY